MNNEKTTASKSFQCKTELIASTPNNNSALHTEVVISLKCLSDFWRSLDLPLVNCEVQLDLTWSRYIFARTINVVWYRVISEKKNTPEIDANPSVDPPIAHASETVTARAKFQINNTKRYVPVLTLVTNNNI